MKTCHRCSAPWESAAVRQPGVKETCERCSAYLHCCLNCRFYDTSKPKQCYIPNLEAVTDKERANFCDEFEFRDAAAEAAGKKESRNAFDALFGESGEEEKGPKTFDDLFGG